LESLKSGLEVPVEVAKNRILKYLTARRKPCDAAWAIGQPRAALRAEFIIITLCKTVKIKHFTRALEEFRVERMSGARYPADPVLHICIAWA
jgi:hypothetical protein